MRTRRPPQSAPYYGGRREAPVGSIHSFDGLGIHAIQYAPKHMTEITEAYKDYEPPAGTRRTVEDLLDSVPKNQLVGLERVVLTNADALTGRRKRSWSWARGRKVRHRSEVAGLYHHASRTEGAWVELFVDKACGHVPPWALRLPVVRAIGMGSVLFHEVGHHIHAAHMPEYREREVVADAWQRQLTRVHVRRQHPVISVAVRPITWLLRLWRSRH